MGHTVLTMPPISNKWINSPIKRYASLLTQKLFPNNFTPQEKWLLKTTKNQKFDCLLCLTQSINENVLEQERKMVLNIK